MTKRAWIIIGIIVLVPVLITGIVLLKWKINTPVVASYGDSVDELHYGQKTLYAVPDPDSYMAELGSYLGKVGSAWTGAPFYTVKYDKTGEIWALVTEKGTVLYTESGELPAAAYGGNRVTAVYFDSFTHRTVENTQRALLAAIPGTSGTAALWQPSEKEASATYRMHFCYGDSAVSTVSPGTLLWFKDSGLWYFLPDAEEQSVLTQIADGDIDEDKAIYRVIPLTDRSTLKLLKALLREGDTSELVLPSSAVTEAPAAPKTPSSAIGSGAVASGAVQSGGMQ